MQSSASFRSGCLRRDSQLAPGTRKSYAVLWADLMCARPASLMHTWAFWLTVVLATFVNASAFAKLLCLAVVHCFRGILEFRSEGQAEELINAKFAIEALVRNDLGVVLESAGLPVGRDLRFLPPSGRNCRYACRAWFKERCEARTSHGNSCRQ